MSGAISKRGTSTFLLSQGFALLVQEGYLMPTDRLKGGFLYLPGHSQTILPGPLSLPRLQAGQQRVL